MGGRQALFQVREAGGGDKRGGRPLSFVVCPLAGSLPQAACSALFRCRSYPCVPRRSFVRSRVDPWLPLFVPCRNRFAYLPRTPPLSLARSYAGRRSSSRSLLFAFFIIPGSQLKLSAIAKPTTWAGMRPDTEPCRVRTPPPGGRAAAGHRCRR